MRRRCARGCANVGLASNNASGSQDPSGPDTLAKKIVKPNVWDLEGVFKSAIWALTKAGICGQRVTGIADGTDLVTTDGYRGGGQVTRTRRLEAIWGRRQDIEVTV
jgi:hypothetical protein